MCIKSFVYFSIDVVFIAVVQMGDTGEGMGS